MRNGILGAGGLQPWTPGRGHPGRNMAAMLVRLLGAKGAEDLSPYRDLNPAAWYNRELSAAVSAEFSTASSATQMAPMRSSPGGRPSQCWPGPSAIPRTIGLYPVPGL
ncbi:MAG: hypothetical protein ACLU9S_13870 [Oscillospiraceae bacterium]